jgi:hypothetical protein
MLINNGKLNQPFITLIQTYGSRALKEHVDSISTQIKNIITRFRPPNLGQRFFPPEERSNPKPDVQTENTRTPDGLSKQKKFNVDKYFLSTTTIQHWLEQSNVILLHSHFIHSKFPELLT